MPTISTHVTETTIAFALLVLAGYFLKRKGVLKQEDGPMFARLLTQAIMPATIFYQLWTHPLSGANFVPVLVMFLSGAAALIVSYIAGVLLKFDRPSIGALMIISSFGSSALIGYPVIQYAFANNPEALAEGIAISELGVGLPIFIFCPLVAMYFGGRFKGPGDLWKLVKDYLLSPIFISVILGLVFSRIDIPEDALLVHTIREALQMTQGALVVISAVILGVQLSFHPVGGFWKLIGVSIAIQMFFEPWFAQTTAGVFRISEENRQILILISTMPAAILGPVFAARYDCAAKTASLLTFTQIAVSPILVPAVFAFLS